MFIDHIEIKKGKIYERVCNQYVIEPAHKRADLLDDVEVILKFNEKMQPYLT